MENINAVKTERNEDREGAVKGIKIHGVVYAFVSALLATINLTTTPARYGSCTPYWEWA